MSSLTEIVKKKLNTVDTIADLRGLVGEEGQQVSVAGYYNVGDGGSGPLRVWKTGEPGTYVDNGGSIIVPNGGNGSSAWVWEWSGAVNIKWFGAAEELADNSPNIQAVYTAGYNAVIPLGNFTCATSITISVGVTSGSSLEGEHKYNSILTYSGNGTFLNGVVDYLHIQNLFIRGATTDLTHWETGSVGITTTGVLTMANVSIRHFDTIHEWAGGYYNKFVNCDFLLFNNFTLNYNGNNFSLWGCRLSSFNNGIRVTGGTGDVVFQSGSIEAWSGVAFGQLAGSNCSFTIKDNYFENYPGTETKNLNPMISAYIFTGSKGEHTFTNNNIQTKGIRRGVFISTGEAQFPVSLFAYGNKWITSTNASSDMDVCYVLPNFHVNNIFIRDPDILPSEVGHTGSYTLSFINGGNSASDYDVYDSVKKRSISRPVIKTLTTGTISTHNGLSNASVLTDTSQSWAVNAFVGRTLFNITDGSHGIIASNTATTITAALIGGTDNDWDAGDSYVLDSTLINGWTTSTASSYYRDREGIVHFEGVINGFVATDNVVFYLPLEFTPPTSSQFTWFSTGTIGASPSLVSGRTVNPMRALRIENMVNGIILTGIAFRARDV